ncbi:armadillo-type protein [Cladochytrium replicatum]|nr:armadillo-type protein [Cladochytrium replicatum]
MILKILKILANPNASIVDPSRAEKILDALESALNCLTNDQNYTDIIYAAAKCLESEDDFVCSIALRFLGIVVQTNVHKGNDTVFRQIFSENPEILSSWVELAQQPSVSATIRFACMKALRCWLESPPCAQWLSQVDQQCELVLAGFSDPSVYVVSATCSVLQFIISNHSDKSTEHTAYCDLYNNLLFNGSLVRRLQLSLSHSDASTEDKLAVLEFMWVLVSSKDQLSIQFLIDNKLFQIAVPLLGDVDRVVRNRCIDVLSTAQSCVVDPSILFLYPCGNISQFEICERTFELILGNVLGNPQSDNPQPSTGISYSLSVVGFLGIFSQQAARTSLKYNPHSHWIALLSDCLLSIAEERPSSGFNFESEVLPGYLQHIVHMFEAEIFSANPARQPGLRRSLVHGVLDIIQKIVAVPISYTQSLGNWCAILVRMTSNSKWLSETTLLKSITSCMVDFVSSPNISEMPEAQKLIMEHAWRILDQTNDQEYVRPHTYKLALNLLYNAVINKWAILNYLSIGDIIRARLNDQSWDIRDHTIEFLCSILDTNSDLEWMLDSGLVISIIERISDTNPQVRASSLQAISVSRDRLLFAFLSTEFSLQFMLRSANLVGYLEQSGIVSLLVEHFVSEDGLKDTEALVRRASASVFHTLIGISPAWRRITVDTPPFCSAIDSILNDPDLEVRLSGVSILSTLATAFLSDDNALECFHRCNGETRIIAGLKDTSGAMRRACLDATVKLEGLKSFKGHFEVAKSAALGTSVKDTEQELFNEEITWMIGVDENEDSKAAAALACYDC